MGVHFERGCLGLKKLDEEIEQLRQEMVRLAKKRGLEHPDVLRYSQRLDTLLLQWHQCHTDRKRDQLRDNIYRMKRVNNRIREERLVVSFL